MPLLPLIPGVGMGGSPAVPPAVPGAPSYAREITSGPPLFGAPWGKFFHEPIHDTPAGSVPPYPTYATEIYIGPPLPGAPWFKAFDPGLNVGVPSPGLPSPVIRLGDGKPLVARRPPVHGEGLGDPRARRLADQEADVFNSLSRRGQLVREAPSEFVIHTAAQSGGAPTAGNDMTQGFAPGDLWVDRGAGEIYVCTSAARGAAVWRRLAFN